MKLKMALSRAWSQDGGFLTTQDKIDANLENGVDGVNMEEESG